ncbi:MAG: hypothetical protein MJ009_01535, partial [Paludibacteraceae bacterium]|nr:hypothetical protein [Paludibacteraceae bacterium]
MSEPIRFYKGEETGIVHENYHDISTSLFKDQYLKALDEIGAYLSYYKTIDEVNNESDDEEDEEQITRQNKSKKQPQHIELNNIFAFIGERGTGKTSCMKSVADMLYQYRKSTNKNGCEKFLKIDPIDPTTFNDNTNLMQVVIGVMFEKFKDKVANSDNLPNNADRDTYEKNKQNLLKAFQDVKECIKYISNPKLLNCEDDDISQLAGMASVSKLNDKIGKLADKYLEFFDKNILVLQIDDIDLQTKYAYQMVEEIRKYFMHKNIIVLMAVKMEQLAKVIENETAKQYEPLKKLEGITLPEISDMAIRYLLKLIPIDHRIFMPSFKVYSNKQLQYFENRNDKTYIDRWMSMKYAVTTLIYKKCRFLFYHAKGEVSPIVPTNLREFRHLFATLYSMKDYYPGEEINDYKYREANKSQFLNYLNGMWVSNNIDASDYKIVDSILNIRDAASINKTVLQLLKSKFETTLFKDERTYIEERAGNRIMRRVREIKRNIFSEILSDKNAKYNVSLGDVYVVLDYIKKRINSLGDRMLIFFIETYYSIKLYEYYDEITTANEQDDSIEEDFERIVDENIRKREVVDNRSNYEVLVGGTFINTDYYSLMPLEQQTQEFRDRRKISFNLLKEYANDVVTSKLDDNVIKKMQLVEFFALCISNVVDADDNVNKSYREYNVLYYDFPPSRRNDYVQFDLGSFFFNIANVHKAYDRIDPLLWKKSLSCNKSLMMQLGLECLNYRYKQPLWHALLSCVCIRNYEVLDDFVNAIQYTKFMRSQTKSNVGNFIDFFNLVSTYSIRTYDKHPDYEYNLGLFKDKADGVHRMIPDVTKEPDLLEKIEAEERFDADTLAQALKVPYTISFKYAK